MNWQPLTALLQLDQISELSGQVPCLIFKHSSRCNISSIAKFRLEAGWDFPEGKVEPFFLDLIAHRQVSAAVAERFAVHHESPQILLIKGGECVLDASHLDISVAEILEVLGSH